MPKGELIFLESVLEQVVGPTHDSPASLQAMVWGVRTRAVLILLQF